MKTESPVDFPYKAVVCGEERTILDWNGDQIEMDNGGFVIKRLRGPDSEYTTGPSVIQPHHDLRSFRLMEIVEISFLPAGDLLINGCPGLRIFRLEFGRRFYWEARSRDILGRFRSSIRGAALFKVHQDDVDQIELDAVLRDWNKAKTSRALPLPWERDYNEDYRLFMNWSYPVWLTEFQSASAWLKLGCIEYLSDFTVIKIKGQPIELSSRPSAMYCYQYLIEQRATSKDSARSLIDEIDPFVREKTELPKAAQVKMADYFGNDRSGKLKSARELVKAAGRNGRYFLSVS